MTKKQRALEVISRLKEEYPDAGCTLDYDQAWKLLVSVRLAAQCTDARVCTRNIRMWMRWRVQMWMTSKPSSGPAAWAGARQGISAPA